MTTYLRAHVPRGSDGAFCYLAWVAYPHEQAQRERFAKAAIVGHYKAAKKHPPPAFRGMKCEHVEAAINRGVDRIEKRRLRAVRVAFTQWEGASLAASLRGLVLPPGEDSEAGMAASNLDDDEPLIPDDERGFGRKLLPGSATEVMNVRNLVWRDSLPALAMTLALPLYLVDRPDTRDPFNLLRRPDWTPVALNAAKELAPVVADKFSPAYLLVPQH